MNPEKAVQFAHATGTSVSLHDLSLAYLAADYDPYMNLGECSPIHTHTHMVRTLFPLPVALESESPTLGQQL